MKQLFADIPDEDRKQIQKLSYKIAGLAEEQGKLKMQVTGLSQQKSTLT